MAIPGSIWEADTRHKGIWQANGPCVKCQLKPRQMMCPRCLEPMCANCLKAHTSGLDHARDRYIERLARNLMPWENSTQEERAEARALQAEWAEAENPKQLAATA